MCKYIIKSSEKNEILNIRVHNLYLARSLKVDNERISGRSIDCVDVFPVLSLPVIAWNVVCQ